MQPSMQTQVPARSPRQGISVRVVIALFALALVAALTIALATGKLGIPGAKQPQAGIAASAPTAIAELYSTGFEEDLYPWDYSRNKNALYHVGLDYEVSYEGKSSGYIKSIADGLDAGMFAQTNWLYSGTAADKFEGKEKAVDTFRSKQIRYSAYVKAEQVEEWAGLWAQVYINDKEIYRGITSSDCVSIDQMSDRPIRGTARWQRYEVVMTVPQNARYVTFGLMMYGRGQVWIDKVLIEEVGTDVPVTASTARDEPCNLGFEEETACWYAGTFEAHLYRGGFDSAVSRTGTTSGYLESEASTPQKDAFLMQLVYAKEYLGKRVRFSAYIKTEKVQGRAGLRMNISGSGSDLGSDKMEDRPVTGTTDWQKYEVVLDVPEESVIIEIGLGLEGTGRAWIDDAQLEVVDESLPVTSPATPTPGS